MTLICLQKKETLQEERVRYFEARIASGKRPVIFALGFNNEGDKYILAGHHKAMAYERLKRTPTIFFIKKHRTVEEELSIEAFKEVVDKLVSDPKS